MDGLIPGQADSGEGWKKQPEPFSLVIQAGGHSRRMGEDKALMPFLGRPLIQRVADRLAPIAAEMLVSTHFPGEYAFLGLGCQADLLPGRGTLGGLYTALACASFPVVAVAACDMPFASPALFQAAVRLLVDEKVDVVVPRSPGELEPLHAVYRGSTCLPVIRAALEAGHLKTIDWFGSVRVRELIPAEIAVYDPAGLAFLNINTRAELAAAEQLARGT